MPTVFRSVLPRLTTLATLAALATLAPRVAAAQRISPAPPGEKPGELVPLVGVQYGAPERFAGILGFGVTTAGVAGAHSGYGIVADGGQGGGRLSLTTFTRVPSGLGAQFRVSALRTWRNSLVVARNQTFAGPELRLSFTALTVGGGYYWRTAGVTPGDHSFSAVTFGIEF